MIRYAVKSSQDMRLMAAVSGSCQRVWRRRSPIVTGSTGAIRPPYGGQMRPAPAPRRGVSHHTGPDPGLGTGPPRRRHERGKLRIPRDLAGPPETRWRDGRLRRFWPAGMTPVAIAVCALAAFALAGLVVITVSVLVVVTGS